jgi:site-specific recombinase XerD
MGRKSIIPDIEKKHGKPVRQLLQELSMELDYKGICEVLGISKSGLYRLLDQYNIKPKASNKVEELDVTGELGTVIQNFLIAKELAGLTKPAILFYKGNLRRFCWWLENEEKKPLKMKFINTDTIRKFLYYVQKTKIRFGGYSNASRRSANRSTMDGYWRTLQAFTSWLIREDYIRKDENPMDRIDRPKQLKVVIPELPEDIIRAILDSFDDDFNGRRDRAIILVLLDTGVRLAELVGIKTEDVDFKNGLIKVMGKGQKERIVPVSPPVLGAIRRYMELREDTSPWLWVIYEGKQFTWWGVDNMIRRLKQKLHVSKNIKLSAHVFRHTFAIRYLRGDGFNLETRGDPFTLQDIGGWTTLDMPNRYAAARKIEDAYKVHRKASPVMNLFGNGENDERKPDEDSQVGSSMEV